MSTRISVSYGQPPEKLTTYDLIAQARAVVDEVSQMDEEEFDGWMAEHSSELSDLFELTEEKVEALFHVNRRFKLEAKALKDEEARLAKRRKQAERAAARVHELGYALVAQHAELTGDKVKCATVTASIRKCPPKVVLDVEVDDLPMRFVRVKESADMAAIKADIHNCKGLAHMEQGDRLDWR